MIKVCNPADGSLVGEAPEMGYGWEGSHYGIEEYVQVNTC